MNCFDLYLGSFLPQYFCLLYDPDKFYIKKVVKNRISVHRLKLQRNCLKKNLIAGQLHFSVPDTIFSGQLLHKIHLKLQRTVTSRVKEDRKKHEEMVVKFPSLLQKETDEELWASVFRIVRRQVFANIKKAEENHRKSWKNCPKDKISRLGGEMGNQVLILTTLNCLDAYKKSCK